MYREFKIEPATLEDVPEIVKLVNSAYRGDTSKMGWTTEADLLDGIRTDETSLREMMNDDNSTFLKYIDEKGQLAGSVYLQKNGSKLYLGMLTVRPATQTKGIGKQLMEAAETFAKQHNCNKIEMTVITVRKELISWYERRGFKSTGETKPFPTDPKFGIPKQHLEFVVLEKELQ